MIIVVFYNKQFYPYNSWQHK